MAEIRGTGAPTKRTKAAVGDLYIDESTGKQYKCVMAYRTSLKEEFEYQWKLKEGATKTATVPIKKVSAEQVKDMKTPDLSNVKPAELKRDQKRKSYSSYSK